MSDLLYNKNTIFGKLFCYFSFYFVNISTSLPTIESLCFMLIAMLSLENANSIRFLYRHFISKITQKSLNAFYYACSYAKVDYSEFMCTTTKIALKVIPENINYHPVFLCIDDTIVPKYGKKFENVSNLFDHAAHNGSSHLNGHCFVSLMLCVPVRKKGKVSYLSIPLGYKMWDKTKTKLVLAAEMVRKVMPQLSEYKNVILMFDSWYAKKDLICVADEFSNLDIICGARVDSVMYDTVVKQTGKAGRPRKYGERLSAKKDFILSSEKINGYFIGTRMVFTNLFGKHMVHAYVTSTLKEGGTRRLFFSTISPARINFAYAWYENAPLNQTGSAWSQYVPLFLYKIRWNIETSYYEQKTFWSLCHYMVRSTKGIEMMVNLINVAYCSMKLLPYTDAEFKKYQGQSIQDFRFYISEQIREQIIFASFVKTLENDLNIKNVINLLKQKVFGCNSAAQKL